jgi:MtN3 and saliva related transmembrane protein
MSSKVGVKGYSMRRFNLVPLAVLVVSVISLTGCQQLTISTGKLVKSDVELSEIIGLLAGFGTTFAAFPDLIAMLKRRSSLGMKPRMSAITGTFQILWIYYGLLIGSRPVILWNVVAVVINFLTVGAYAHFLRKEKQAQAVAGSTRMSA